MSSRALGDVRRFCEEDEGLGPEAGAIRLLMAVRRAGFTDTRILSVLERVPRGLFVPDVFGAQAFDDNALPIECGQTISQPSVVALMTAALEVGPRHKVLEVGTGSGYQTAVLAQLARRVYTLERYRTLLRQAERRFNVLDLHTVVTRLGDGCKGWPEQAPFDRIIVTAAGEEVPLALTEQLRPGGILVIPVGPEFGMQSLKKVVRTETGLEETDLGPVRFVPLVEGLARGA